MNDPKTATAEKTESKEKPGFFKRMVDKLDGAMKEKAEEKSQQSCCGGSDTGDGKGGRCC